MVFSKCPDARKISDVASLIKLLPFESICFDETQLPALLCADGFAAKKTIARLHCVCCKLMLMNIGGELLKVDID